MRHYELVVVLSPMLNQEQTSETWDRIKGFINTREGEVTYEEHWGTRRLAYSIKKGPYHFQEGSYHLNRFRTESPFNIELETFLRLDEQVLRSMVVATDTPLPAPGSASPGIARPAPVAAAPPAPEAAEAPAAEAEAPVAEAEAPEAVAEVEAPVAEAEEPEAEEGSADAESTAAEPESEPEDEEKTPG